MSERGLVYIVDHDAPSADALQELLEKDGYGVGRTASGADALESIAEAGFILTGQDLIRDGRRPKNWTPKRDPFLLETSVPGIFAAGDVRHGVVRRVASAVGQGAVTVNFVHKYLETV